MSSQGSIQGTVGDSKQAKAESPELAVQLGCVAAQLVSPYVKMYIPIGAGLIPRHGLATTSADPLESHTMLSTPSGLSVSFKAEAMFSCSPIFTCHLMQPCWYDALCTW